jgi:hypothetical protein
LDIFSAKVLFNFSTTSSGVRLVFSTFSLF